MASGETSFGGWLHGSSILSGEVSLLQSTWWVCVRFMGEFHKAFPDFRSVIEDQIAEGDKVVTRWRASGTHQGEFRGIAPTGNKITVTGIGIFRFSEDGKVVESWDSMDQLGMMQPLESADPAGYVIM